MAVCSQCHTAVWACAAPLFFVCARVCTTRETHTLARRRPRRRRSLRRTLPAVAVGKGGMCSVSNKGGRARTALVRYGTQRWGGGRTIISIGNGVPPNDIAVLLGCVTGARVALVLLVARRCACVGVCARLRRCAVCWLSVLMGQRAPRMTRRPGPPRTPTNPNPHPQLGLRCAVSTNSLSFLPPAASGL